ncbi:signal transduction histidine kinase [Actinophytocola oryzae]|uniref:Signal transduction histidine kinase n=2 Tax=Actinophytocola oryzae TaxID=502181 RepID=A0A4R7VUI4_9PSEU|nr:signal transduction histidine kinase [Actinophytocola oryzae]
MTSSAVENLDRTTVPGPVDDAEDHGALIALTLARAIVATVFCGFGSIALLWVLEERMSVGEILLAVTCLGALLALQYFYFGRPSVNLASPQAYGMFVLQALLAYLPVIVFGQAWVSQPSFLAGSALLVMRSYVAWPVFTAITISTGVAQYYVSSSSLDVVYILVNTGTAGLFVYGLTRLARLVTALHEARDELAKTEVAHERLRFARDLHDLLGLSLSAIAPKGELALRLVRRNPGRAERELSEILEISRRALADVRSIARLYREISLNDETQTIQQMLAASDVELQVEVELRELPSHMRTSLSALLREGVAYVLRHRDVEHCEIVLRQEDGFVTVEIVNDEPGEVPDDANDFENLQTMVSRMAGRLSVEVDAGGRLRLHVRLPVTARSPEGTHAAADQPRRSMPEVATKLAGGLVVAVLCGLFLQAVMRLMFVDQDVRHVAIGSAYLLASLVLQLAYFSRPGVRLHSPTGYLLLGLQALLVGLPWLQFNESWTGLPGFLAGSALLVLRPALGWTVFAVVTGAVAWTQIGSGTLLPSALGQIFVQVDLALVTYGLTWMARTVRQLRAARQELAEVALAETRLRFARDLHDLLGLSLSAITLKSELAYRLILLDPKRAGVELAEVLEISRHALADVRSVASGYHEMSLEEECRTAESLLTTAGLAVRMDVAYEELPPEVSTVLATVLREGVTNVLRHSKGECCEISIRTQDDGVRLNVVNDGATLPSERDKDGWGSGIRNMSDRVAALGGLLTALYEGDSRFGLCARIPIAH